MDLEEDFYQGYSDNSDVDRNISGITGIVTDYTYSKLDFPCLVLKDGASFPEHKLMVLSKLIGATKEGKKVNIYFKDKGELFSIGEILGSQVMSVIDILGEENLEGFLDKDTRVTGSNIYALSMLSI